MAKGSYDCAIKILTLCNEYCKDNKVYIKYINNFNYKGKEEAIDNGSNSLLSL